MVAISDLIWFTLRQPSVSGLQGQLQLQDVKTSIFLHPGRTTSWETTPSKPLKDSDIVNIDVAVIKGGWFGDTSRMYFVGTPSVLAQRLVRTTYEAMRVGILQVCPGTTLGDFGHAIQSVAHKEGFSVVRGYCGHGIGEVHHDAPQVPQPGAAAAPAQDCV